VSAWNGSPPGNLEALAPEPRIRVGLATRARTVRLSSSSPFLLGAGDRWVTMRDVLVELDAGTTIEGAVYRVQLGSFPLERDAVAFRDRLREDLDVSPTVVREAGTGRFAVRAGELESETGARALLDELALLGLEGLVVVRESAVEPRPRGLVLTGFGREPLRTPELAMLAVPRTAGAFIEVDGRPYRGYVGLRVNGSNLLTVVNTAALEDYLRGVVPAELSPSVFPEKEALKAQAIAARTYAVKRAGQFAAEGYDICDTPACQVYRGVSVEQRLSDEAVAETRGEVLTYDGELVDALYTSTCGGRTEDAENVFSTAEPYLKSRLCFTERGAAEATSANEAPLPLAAAVLSRLGVVTALPPVESAVSVATARRWLAATLDHLGQSPCWAQAGEAAVSEARAVDAAAFAALLGEGLCWDRRLPYLVSPLDAERIVDSGTLPETSQRSLAFAIREGLVAPPADGLRPGAPLGRDEVLGTLYRLVVERGDPPLREGTILEAAGGRLRLRDRTLDDEENEVAAGLAPTRYLYRDVSGQTYYAPRLTLLPSDRVRFHLGEGGVDLLVLEAEGGSFDRTSRFSHWVVRKSNEDLSREVGLQHPVGRILELRPKRYGRSGRLAELDVVGTDATVTLKGLAIRRALGIRENLFFFDAQRGADGAVRSWVFTGRGWGHGVGLCQVGAYGMAAAGYGYRQILGHYYTGTEVSKLDERRLASRR
jgi:stage II sporulation protein D